jgi:hypothetical protein
VDIPDVGRTILFKARFRVEFRFKLRVVVHGWWWEGRRDARPLEETAQLCAQLITKAVVM